MTDGARGASVPRPGVRVCPCPGPVDACVVVGGGIAGLTAARALAQAGRDVLVLEGAPRHRRQAADRARSPASSVDIGAESMLARRPEGVDLARELGLPDGHPATTTSAIWTHGGVAALAALGDGRAHEILGGGASSGC